MGEVTAMMEMPVAGSTTPKSACIINSICLYFWVLAIITFESLNLFTLPSKLSYMYPQSRCSDGASRQAGTEHAATCALPIEGFHGVSHS